MSAYVPMSAVSIVCHADDARRLQTSLAGYPDQQVSVSDVTPIGRFVRFAIWCPTSKVSSLRDSVMARLKTGFDDEPAPTRGPTATKVPAYPVDKPAQQAASIIRIRPKYGSVDLTWFVLAAIFPWIAFVFRDVAIGVGLLGSAYWMRRRGATGPIKNAILTLEPQQVKRVTASLVYVGAATIVFGLLTGSFFGSLPEFIYPGLKRWVLLDPSTHPRELLFATVGFGLLNLGIGLAARIINGLRVGIHLPVVLLAESGAVLSAGIGWILTIGTVAKIVVLPSGLATIGPFMFAVTAVCFVVVIAIEPTRGMVVAVEVLLAAGSVLSATRIFATSMVTTAVDGIAMTAAVHTSSLVGIPVFVAVQLVGFALTSFDTVLQIARLVFAECSLAAGEYDNVPAGHCRSMSNNLADLPKTGGGEEWR
jgi:vacuolar-type H+-ATPase subunit I/STV1